MIVFGKTGLPILRYLRVRSGRSGVALVITLLMLSIITFLAVGFLALTRRERGAVVVSVDQTDARFVLEHGLARAQAELILQMQRATSILSYDLIVSTNSDGANITNINQLYPVAAIAGLSNDARVPVYSPTNASRPPYDYRFYLDLNRNRTNDYTGLVTNLVIGFTNYSSGDPHWVGVLDNPLQPHGRFNKFLGRFAFIVLPTSKSLDINFVHNYAKRPYYPPFAQTNISYDGFLRNQGYANWEYNLAGFLTDLNTNFWNYSKYQPYSLNIASGSAPLPGDSFQSAVEVLAYRYGTNLNFLLSFSNTYPANLFGGPIGIQLDGIDGYSDGPLVGGTSGFFDVTNPINPNDNPILPWSGGRNANAILSFEELVDVNLVNRYGVTNFNNNFQQVLTNAMNPANSLDDRTTLYRMLAQMGTDSVAPNPPRIVSSSDFTVLASGAVRVFLPGHNFVLNDHVRVINPATTNGGTFRVTFVNANTVNFEQPPILFTNVPPNLPGTWPPAFTLQKNEKIHLNCNNQNYVPENFVPWTPLEFFLTVSDRLLRLHTNSYVTNVLSATNLPIFPTNAYDGKVHQAFQLAANLWDAATNTALGTATNATPGYPTVFRPIFETRNSSNDVVITGFAEVDDATNFFTYTYIGNFRDVNDPADRALINTNSMIWGHPLVIGARKGYPNFNEFNFQTYVEMARRLELRKTNTSGSVIETNQYYTLRVETKVAVEAWNSYTNNAGTNYFPRNLSIGVDDRVTMALTNQAGALLWPQTNPFVTNLGGVSNIMVATAPWRGSLPAPRSQIVPAYSFQIPLETNFTFLGTNVISTNSGLIKTNSEPLVWVNQINAFRFIQQTNQYELGQGFYVPQWFLLVTNRLRYYLLDSNRIVDFISITNVQYVDLQSNLAGNVNLIGGTNAGNAAYWDTNRVAGANSETRGISKQILDSRSGRYPSTQTGAQSPSNRARIFNQFISNQPTNLDVLTMQTPYNPVAKVYATTSMQVNDPLVHYTQDDLLGGLVNQVTNELPVSNLRQISTRYSPWGSKRVPGNSTSYDPSVGGDNTAYDMGFKDPMVRWSDEWDFPTNKFGNVGAIGRVHRGTPWQTIYLKSLAVGTNEWRNWSGNIWTTPTSDWQLADLFTVAVDDNAQRGLLSVNQTNIAAWSALFSGMPVLTNLGPGDTNAPNAPMVSNLFIGAASPELNELYLDIQNTRLAQPAAVFSNLASFLQVPKLTMGTNNSTNLGSPFLDFPRFPAAPIDQNASLTDAAVERIPQQALSLLTVEDVPRVTVYVWGQSLKPADRSVFTGSGPEFGVVTNYQISGETAAKATLRVEKRFNPANPAEPTFRTVIESFQLLPNP